MFRTEAEAASESARRELQGRRLNELVRQLATSRNPFWRTRLADVDPSRIRSVDDLRELPFTWKSDLRDSYPWGMLAVPRSLAVRAHASSGTSGKPTIVAYTAHDVGVFSEVVARSLVCAGARSDDVLHVAYGYGLFTGGLGLHYGGEKLGATVVPASGGNTDLQLQLLADLGADGLACTPSFAMLLAEKALAEGVTGLKVRYLVCGAEPWSEGFRSKLEAAWSGLTGHPVIARDIYGLSEVIGPGVAMECAENPGSLHVFDDHFLPEVLDPETEKRLPDGERGELVLTTITKEALPVIRYRTGDVTALERGTCACGRTHPRIARIEGRTDDMLIIRGVNVFPREIESVLMEEPALNGAYAIVVDRRETLPRLDIHAEVMGSEPPADLTEGLRHKLASRLRVNPSLTLHPEETLPRTAVGKVKRVFERVDATDPLGLDGDG
jgi:phenylacetate-CoA ligase